MTTLKRGKLYRLKGVAWLRKGPGPIENPANEWLNHQWWGFLGKVPKNAVVMFIEQSLQYAFAYKVVHDDQIGWITGSDDQFHELTEEEEPPGEAR